MSFRTARATQQDLSQQQPPERAKDSGPSRESQHLGSWKQEEQGFKVIFSYTREFRASLSLKIPVAAGTHSGFCREFCIPHPPFFFFGYST